MLESIKADLNRFGARQEIEPQPYPGRAEANSLLVGKTVHRNMARCGRRERAIRNVIRTY